MDHVITTQIEAIRAAFADGASDDDRRAGAIACRTLLTVLDAQPSASPAVALPTAPITTALAQLGRLDAGQVLDLVIRKLQSMLPPGTAAPTPSGFRAPTLPLPGKGAQ